MTSAGIFFNNRAVADSFRFSDVPVALGDWFLTPVRCLYNGNKVTISHKNDAITIEHEKEYSDWDNTRPKRNFLRVILSIILIVPGVIVGSIFKGIGYLSQSIQHRHTAIRRHYSPGNIVGDESDPPDLKTIEDILKNDFKHIERNNKSCNALVVNAKKGTRINVDPGILSENPQKIILVGARIVHEPTREPLLDDTLYKDPSWESGSRIFYPCHYIDPNEVTYVKQFPVSSIEEAMQDEPPKRPDSDERYKRVYLVE